MDAFEILRKAFLAELAGCTSRADASFLAGATHISDECPGSKLVSHMAAIANVNQRPMEGRWGCHREIQCAGRVYAQIFTKGQTMVIWLEPDTGYYIEFELDLMPVRR